MVTARHIQKGLHLLQSHVQVLLILGRSSQQEHLTGVLQQRDDAEEDERGDEERADGVGDEPAELADEDGGDDDAHAAQRVGQDVEENTWREGREDMTEHEGGKVKIKSSVCDCVCNEKISLINLKEVKVNHSFY